jgi:hypothetical protein
MYVILIVYYEEANSYIHESSFSYLSPIVINSVIAAAAIVSAVAILVYLSIYNIGSGLTVSI